MTKQTPSNPDVAAPADGDTDDEQVLRRTADDLLDGDFEPPVPDEKRGFDRDDEDDSLPPFTEQLSQQLGGVRGIVESGIPVAVFVLTNILWEDGLRWAIIAAVAVAVGIAVMRAIRKEPIRHALNGLFGIGLGAWLAWRSGEQRDFYLPGILQGGAYGLVLIGSVIVRHPLVGWFWSVIAGGGKSAWRDDARLVRVFSWLTLLWGAVFLLKNIARWALYVADLDNVLGIVTIVGGYPVTALLVIVTLWAVRRVRPREAVEST